jgi:hypothetical protein
VRWIAPFRRVKRRGDNGNGEVGDGMPVQRTRATNVLSFSGSAARIVLSARLRNSRSPPL